MKLIVDFLPLLVFFVAYKMYDIYTATAVLMLSTVIQMAFIYQTEKRLQTIHKITLALVLVFGALTLALHDETFIKWKPTILYAGMSIALAVGLWGMKKNFLKLLLGSQLPLPDNVWTNLNIAWVGYTAFMSAINAYVAANFSTDDWVNFKLWGYVFPLTFLVVQGVYIAKHLKTDQH
jgi:intracellular septation protein